MTWQWILAVFLVLSGMASFLPLIFERESKASRFFSLCYQLRLYQHLYPDEGQRSGRIISELISHKDRWTELTPETIGKRMRTIRELTGGDRGKHLLAVELGGALVQELASSGWIRSIDRYAVAPRSATDILQDFAVGISAKDAPAATDPDKDGKVRSWVRSKEIDLEQVVELLLAVIEILHARVETDTRDNGSEALATNDQ